MPDRRIYIKAISLVVLATVSACSAPVTPSPTTTAMAPEYDF